MINGVANGITYISASVVPGNLLEKFQETFHYRTHNKTTSNDIPYITVKGLIGSNIKASMEFII